MIRASKAKVPEDAGDGEVLTLSGTPPASLQQLWFAVQRLSWTSLVIMPAGPETSAFEVATTLHEIGKLTMGDRLRLIDARGVKLTGTAAVILDMSSAAPVRAAQDPRNERVLVLIDWVLAEPSGVPIALAADAALLCVELGKTTVAGARETVQLVGRQRFVGCITYSP